MMKKIRDFFHELDKFAWLTIIGIILLFSTSIIVILIAPSYVDPSWTEPTSRYQVQMYEISDPNLYIGSAVTGATDLQFVYHLKEDFTLLAFQEDNFTRIVAPPDLETYVTRLNDPTVRLTSRLLMLRPPQSSENQKDFNPVEAAEKLHQQLREQWEKDNPDWKEKGLFRPDYAIVELYIPGGKEAFATAPIDGIIENWISDHYVILDESVKQLYHQDKGVIYINNPQEYRLSRFTFGEEEGWRYDPQGEPIKTLDQLRSHQLGFRSRKELIQMGEQIYAIEGCWYCHTDQTRTLIQDTVLNGSPDYPAPPSSANEYIYQRITFPGTKRNGPDISRTGIKKPSRDWHKGHFWSPKTASTGSIMPSFKHFFDEDPRGTSKTGIGLPNYQFEAIYQYLMTKGTRITPPDQAWWLGKDPVNTKAIIEGKKKFE
jgi:cytochrome c oxidase cbb3-type subunit 2